MKTRELIERLLELDPSGEMRAAIWEDFINETVDLVPEDISLVHVTEDNEITDNVNATTVVMIS